MTSIHSQNLFPNTTTNAYYNQLNQFITINKYEKQDFKNLNVLNVNSVEKISLLIHELTHWIDHLSTYWGQDILSSIYNASNNYLQGNVSEFWRIKLLDNKLKNNSFQSYYTEKFHNIQGNKYNRWKYSLTAGIRFTDEGKPDETKPILFTRFFSGNDEPIIRVPMSVSSILEVNAIYQEYKVKVICSKSLDDPFEKAMYSRELEEEFYKLVYNPDLVVYNVAAHLTANINKYSDVLMSFEQSSRIGTVALNLPDDIIDSIFIESSSNNEWNERAKWLIKNRDRGFVYYTLSNNLTKKYGSNSYTLENLLDASNLPNKSDIERLVSARMFQNISNLSTGPLRLYASRIIEQGANMFISRGLDGAGYDNREFLKTIPFQPNITFGDTLYTDDSFNVDDVVRKFVKDDLVTVDEFYYLFNFLEEKFREFVEICGI